MEYQLQYSSYTVPRILLVDRNASENVNNERAFSVDSFARFLLF